MKLAHYYNKIITLSPRYREILLIGYTYCHLSFGLVAVVAYRIAGNIGGEKTLAVWRCKLKFVNIKSVKLKIRYKTTCDRRHVEVLQKSERNDTA